MDEERFWSLIDSQIKPLKDRLDFSALVGALEKLTPEEVADFVAPEWSAKS